MFVLQKIEEKQNTFWMTVVCKQPVGEGFKKHELDFECLLLSTDEFNEKIKELPDDRDFFCEIIQNWRRVGQVDEEGNEREIDFDKDMLRSMLSHSWIVTAVRREFFDRINGTGNKVLPRRAKKLIEAANFWAAQEYKAYLKKTQPKLDKEAQAQAFLDMGVSAQSVQKYKKRKQVKQQEPGNEIFEIFPCNWHAFNVFIRLVDHFERNPFTGSVERINTQLMMMLMPVVTQKFSSVLAPDDLDYVDQIQLISSQAIRELRRYEKQIQDSNQSFKRK